MQALQWPNVYDACGTADCISM